MSEPLLDEQVKASDTASDFLASSELKEKQIEQEAEVKLIKTSLKKKERVSKKIF